MSPFPVKGHNVEEKKKKKKTDSFRSIGQIPEIAKSSWSEEFSGWKPVREYLK